MRTRKEWCKRDITPENILISSGTAVVADFGIAKALSAAKTNAPGVTITQIGTSLGTPAYIAPEQAIGDATTDHRADICSFGVTAYELVAGRHPFADRTSPQQLIAAHIATEPPPRTQWPSASAAAGGHHHGVPAEGSGAASPHP